MESKSLSSALRRAAPYALVLCLTVVIGCGGGTDGGTDGGRPTLQVTSASFLAGATIPAVHLYNASDCNQLNLSPQLSWTLSVPGTVQGYAVAAFDLDAANFVHWLLFNIPLAVTSLIQGVSPLPFLEGPNEWPGMGYGGPCPPVGSGVHRYVFKVYALPVADVRLLPGWFPTMTAQQLLNLLDLHAIATGEVLGTLAR